MRPLSASQRDILAAMKAGWKLVEDSVGLIYLETPAGGRMPTDGRSVAGLIRRELLIRGPAHGGGFELRLSIVAGGDA